MDTGSRFLVLFPSHSIDADVCVHFFTLKL